MLSNIFLHYNYWKFAVDFYINWGKGKISFFAQENIEKFDFHIRYEFYLLYKGAGDWYALGMTVEQFVDFLNARRDFSFEYGGKRYALRAESDGKCGLKVFFGQEYGLMQEFEDVKELLALAKVGNSFLRAILGYLDL